MKRTKWLSIKLPIPLSDISLKLLQNQYSEKNGEGVILSSSTGNLVSGKFIEKSTILARTTDPFGNVNESIVTSYYVSNFKITDSTPFIEIIDPPRSLKKFTNYFHTLFGLGLVIAELKIDPLHWLTHLENELCELSVVHIAASGITVPQNGLAKISISGKKDIRAEFEEMLGNKYRIIDSIKFMGTVSDCVITGELTKIGGAKVTGHLYDGLFDSLRNCLEPAI